jgi:hypothetical protein
MKIKAIRSRFFGAVMLLVLNALCFVGCNSDRHNISPEEAVIPKPPAFLIGPAGVLLTNVSGYVATLSFQQLDPADKSPILSGHILAQGSHLLFAPVKGDKTYIWDVQQHSGYVLSESLQGYAPISSMTQISSILTTSATAGPASDKVNGLGGHTAEISIALNDGSTARFSVWRAADFDDLPVRIKTLTASAPFELNLSEVRHTTFSTNVFLPPDGFARYASPELLNTELLARKSKLRSPGINNADDEPKLPQHKNL